MTTLDGQRGFLGAERVTEVLIVDDHQIVRDGLRVVLAATSDFECIGEARNGVEAVALSNELSPDMIIMDLKMPDMDGIIATREVLTRHPEILVVALTMYEDDATVVRAMQAGARGYLLKGATHEEIVQTLRTISAGGLVFSPGVAGQVLRRLSSGSRKLSPFPQLTARESEVLELLCRGAGDHRIAQQLHIEPKTVRNHIASIISKTGADNRLEVVIWANDAGVGKSP